jgi:ribulose-5-phosphate 4-epimerase/fuculose-1-phosphate aldolase
MAAVPSVPCADETTLRTLLAASCRILYQQGLSDYLGHPSARVPGTERVLIKPKHSPRVLGMDRMTAADIVAIDLDGNLLEGADPPPAERFIHTAIYRARPDVFSVVHTHQPLSTLLGIVEQPILPLLHVEAPLVERPVPTFPCAELVVTEELGRGLAAALGDHAVCHLQGHGIVSVATTVQEATLGAIHLERLAEANYRVAQLGRPPRVIPPHEIEALRRHLASPEGRWAYYVSLASQGGAA